MRLLRLLSSNSPKYRPARSAVITCVAGLGYDKEQDRHSEASVRYYNLKKTGIVLTLAALIVMALWALGLLRTGTVAY
jgi:hypothetical protein